MFLKRIADNCHLKTKKTSNQYYIHFQELRRHLTTFELLPGAPLDEFDLLVSHLLNHLYTGAEHETVYSLIERELIVSFGMCVDENLVEDITNDIMNWWELNNVSSG